MTSFEQLGRAARDAFIKQRVKDGENDMYGPWEKVSKNHQAAWIAAARAVAEQIAAVH